MIPGILYPTPEEWRAELLSKKYRRGNGHLRSSSFGLGKPKHCCIGVYCEMVLAANPDTPSLTEDISSALSESASWPMNSDMPDWLLGYDEDADPMPGWDRTRSHLDELSVRNDVAENDKYWSEQGPVITYIDNHIIKKEI